MMFDWPYQMSKRKGEFRFINVDLHGWGHFSWVWRCQGPLPALPYNRSLEYMA